MKMKVAQLIVDDTQEVEGLWFGLFDGDGDLRGMAYSREEAEAFADAGNEKLYVFPIELVQETGK